VFAKASDTEDVKEEKKAGIGSPKGSFFLTQRTKKSRVFACVFACVFVCVYKSVSDAF